jgi:AsmA protein
MIKSCLLEGHPMKGKLRYLWIGIAVLVIVLICVPFFINVDSFRPTLEKELSRSLGREVKVGKLSLSLFSGSVVADDITIADDPAFSAAPFVTAKSFRVGVEIFPLIFSKVLHVTNLRLEEPKIALRHDAAGNWNFSKLGGAPASKAPEEKTGEEVPLDLSVGRLAITDGTITLSQVGDKKLRTFDKVNMELRDFSASSSFPFTFSSGLPGGGKLELEGTTGPLPSKGVTQTPLQAEFRVGKAVAHLDGSLNTSGGKAILQLKLVGEGMPVNDLNDLLPAAGVTLPAGASLKGGTLSMNLAANGPLDRLVTTGSVKLADTQLKGFDLGQKLSVVGKLAGIPSDPDTTIQNASTEVRVAPDGVRLDRINLNLPTIGQINGNGTVSPEKALNFKMQATLSGKGLAGKATQIVGLGTGDNTLPFLVQGTAEHPQFLPDVAGMAEGEVKSIISGQGAAGALGGFFGKKKK